MARRRTAARRRPARKRQPKRRYDATVNGGNLDDYLPEPARGGRAVALVGYSSGRFVVRNCWGTDRGDGGFGYASLGYAAEAFTEACGVEV